MKQYQNQLFLFSSILSIVFFLVISCDSTESSGGNDPCPAGGHNNLITAGMQKYAYTDFAINGSASVSWRVNCQEVCTDEHASVDVELRVRPNPGVSAEATILYGILRERPMNLQFSGLGSVDQYSGSDAFGIKDYYGEGTVGEFTVLVTMFFPSQNTTWAADSMFVANNVTSVTIYTKYGRR